MTPDALGTALATLLGELMNGASPTGGWMLNRSDPGFLASLDRVSAAAASRLAPGGSSIAAHTDHVVYALSLMNRWAAGENPWKTADWKASWARTTVTDAEWARQRSALRDQVEMWLANLRTPRATDDAGYTGMISSVAHVAYHVGAIRQLDGAARGPKASD